MQRGIQECTCSGVRDGDSPRTSVTMLLIVELVAMYLGSVLVSPWSVICSGRSMLSNSDSL